MADDRPYERNTPHLPKGHRKVTCPRCAFEFQEDQLIVDANGIKVDGECADIPKE